MGKNSRKHERFPTDAIFRIYSNITSCKYTVHLKDLSKKGAFIQTEHIPKVNDIITYFIVDDHGMDKFVGNAKVVWCKIDCPLEERGFGIELENELQKEIKAALKE